MNLTTTNTAFYAVPGVGRHKVIKPPPKLSFPEL